MTAISAAQGGLLLHVRQLLGVAHGVQPGDEAVVDAYRYDGVDLAVEAEDAGLPGRHDQRGQPARRDRAPAGRFLRARHVCQPDELTGRRIAARPRTIRSGPGPRMPGAAGQPRAGRGTAFLGPDKELLPPARVSPGSLGASPT